MEQTVSDQKGEGRLVMVERRGKDRQRTCANDPRTWTTVREWRVGWVEEDKGGKIGTTVIE